MNERDAEALIQMEPGEWFNWNRSLPTVLGGFVRRGWLEVKQGFYRLTDAGEIARDKALEWEPDFDE